MSVEECRELIDTYLEWLRHKFTAENLEDACEITTPFVDRHNDHVQVYVTKRNGRILLSDDGYMLADLRTSGLDLNTPKRKATFETIINGFGVKTDGRQLLVEASPRNVGQRLHSLIQAMLAVSDMFVMAQARVATFFWEDVRDFFDENEIRYSPRVKLPGRSGYDHAVDFLIPKSRSRPERIAQAISAPGRSSVASFLFVLEDTRGVRGEPCEAYAILNDRDRDVGGDVIEALEAYEVSPVLWSHRREFVAALSN